MPSTLETGDLFFLYTPRPWATTVHGLEEIAELAIILSPDQPGRRRLLVLQGKQLPPPRRRWVATQPLLAVVAALRKRPEDLIAVLEERALGAGAWPAAVRPTARVCGEGRYAFVIHADHSDFAYVLELPAIPGEVQDDLGLAASAVYRVEARIPLRPGIHSRRHERRITAHGFGDFFDLVDLMALDIQGNELRLMPASEGAAISAITLQAERAGTAEAFGELKLRRGRVPLDPLLTGSWRSTA